MTSYDRSRFLKVSCRGSLAAGLLGIIPACGFLFAHPDPLVAQTSLRAEELRVLQGTPREEQYREMLLNFLLREAGHLTEKRRARLNSIQTEADFRNWQETNRQKFFKIS